jgi:hypothetical protein
MGRGQRQQSRRSGPVRDRPGWLGADAMIPGGRTPTEFKRLGRQGSYRLGRLRTQGVREAPQPVPFRPSFARGRRRGPAVAWLAALTLGVLVIVGGAELGWWFGPFVVGLAAGLANRTAGWRPPVALPAVAAMALAGWGIPLLWQTFPDGQMYGPAAREFGPLLGVPAHSPAVLIATLVFAVAQALVGYWLGRAAGPRRSEAR